LNRRYYVELFTHHSEEWHPCGVVAIRWCCVEMVLYSSMMWGASSVEFWCVFVYSRVRHLRLDSLYIIDEDQSENVVTFRCVFFRYVVYEVRCRRSEMVGILVVIIKEMFWECSYPSC